MSRKIAQLSWTTAAVIAAFAGVAALVGGCGVVTSPSAGARASRLRRARVLIALHAPRRHTCGRALEAGWPLPRQSAGTSPSLPNTSPRVAVDLEGNGSQSNVLTKSTDDASQLGADA